MTLGQVLTLAGTVVIALSTRFLYGVLFGKADEQVRSALLNARSRRKHNRLVKGFVSAATGYYHVRTEGSLLIISTMLLICTLVSAIAANSSIEAHTRIGDPRQAELKGKVEDLLMELDGKKQRTEKTKEQIRAELLSMRESMAATDAEIDRLRRWMQRVPLALGVFVMVCHLVLILRHRFGASARVFGFEIQRFTLRIQGLASKAELAEFAVAEARVTDEATLRNLVEVAKRIAERHSVPQLAARFDLWSL